MEAQAQVLPYRDYGVPVPVLGGVRITRELVEKYLILRATWMASAVALIHLGGRVDNPECDGEVSCPELRTTASGTHCEWL
jgi:hypothetical protein